MNKIKELINKVFISAESKRACCIMLAVSFAIAALGVRLKADMAAVAPVEGIPVPIIMYHSVLKSPKKQTKYIVTPSQLEADMKWLRDNGYTAVFVADLVEYVYNGKELPKKPVVITFDDGYYNNLTYMYPLLKKYNMRASISVVGKYSQDFSETMDLNPAYAHLTWSNIREMYESGYVEILNHSYDMHSNTLRQGCAIMQGEGYGEYKAALTEDVMQTQRLLEENCSVVPIGFTYPYGHICKESEEILRELGFKVTLSCYEKINYITRDESCLYSLKRFNRDSTLSTKTFMSKISQ